MRGEKNTDGVEWGRLKWIEKEKPEKYMTELLESLLAGQPEEGVSFLQHKTKTIGPNYLIHCKPF